MIMDNENLSNIMEDENPIDIEELTKVHNLDYGNDVLHPTGRTTDVSSGRLSEAGVRYASVVFEPKIGCCTDDPPFKLAYGIVKKEIDKVTFKYELSSWINWYAIRVDTVKRGCDVNGTPCVITQIPYGTFDIEKAKEFIISYVTEVMSLIHQEKAVLYFDTSISFRITCKYDEEGNLESSNVEDIIECTSVSCIINSAGIKSAAVILQEAVENHNEKDQLQVSLYLMTDKYPNAAPQCIMMCASSQNHNDYTPRSAFVEAIKEEIDSSMLSFTNYTVI